ncbi:MAG: TrkH family potassium uptake protein [Treponema sp.]|jgi:trk system potassium uptake protein TrkH|nr:TrkH family potassium uptake protein [Treponema sp.]
MKLSVSRSFSLIFLAWAAACLLGALPYFLSGYIPDFAGAVFESVSGFTTTGATVIKDVEALPKALLFWRAMSQWLGGMGIVALFPLLGAGGPGSEAGNARMLWFIYAALTGVQTLLLGIAGMGWFDALTHAFSTMSTGGFSVRNAGIAYYRSPAVEWICAGFMLLAGFNFTLVFQLLRGKFRDVWRNSEARAYFAVILAGVLLISCAILPQCGPAEEALRYAVFHFASILTTSGFFCADYNAWPPLAQGALFFAMFMGGCTGSAAGGIKALRHVVLWKQTGNEIKKIVHPRGVFTLQLNGTWGKKNMVYGVSGFVFLYFLVLVLCAFLVSGASAGADVGAGAGEDVFTSINMALLFLGNIGLGLGKTGPFLAFPDYPEYVKWGLSFVMLLGRLELWAVLVFFSRDFWRR